jgi:hypothetical protein
VEGTYLVSRLRDVRAVRQRVRVGTPDPTLTPSAGMAAVSEAVERLDVIGALDRAVGPIKQRKRGHTAGQLLVGIAAAQLAGEDFQVGLDRQRADAAGQLLAPVPGLCSTTAAGLARRLSAAQWRQVEVGVGRVAAAALGKLARARRVPLTGSVTIDLDTTDVEVYGRKKRGVAYNYQGVRHEAPAIEWRWEDSAAGLSQRSGGSWGQPDPGDAGEGGKRPRQGQDVPVPPDGAGLLSEVRRCNASEPVVEAP